MNRRSQQGGEEWLGNEPHQPNHPASSLGFGGCDLGCILQCPGSRLAGEVAMDSNLVDSASSHTLVSKIKPCMSKYKYLTLKLRTAHYISYNLFDSPLLLG